MELLTIKKYEPRRWSRIQGIEILVNIDIILKFFLKISHTEYLLIRREYHNSMLPCKLCGNSFLFFIPLSWSKRRSNYSAIVSIPPEICGSNQDTVSISSSFSI